MNLLLIILHVVIISRVCLLASLRSFGLVLVLQKRIESLTEAELEALLEQVEEEKRRLASGEQVN